MVDLGTLIDDFLAHVPDVRRRELRARLAHVIASPLAVRDAATIGAEDVHALIAGLCTAGVPAERAGAVVDALRLVFAYAVAQGILTASPLVGLATPPPAAGPSPTTAIVALGEQVAAWTVRVIVIGFVLAALGLIVALA